MIFVHAKTMAFSEMFRRSDEATRLPKSTQLEDLTDEQRAAEDWSYDAAPVPPPETNPCPCDDEPISSPIVKRTKPKE